MLKAYPIAGKQKSRDICRAFVEGAPKHVTGSVFYGVNESNVDAWRSNDDRWYIDNAYFDSCRQTYFRISRNAIQHPGRGESDGKRFAALGIPIMPWRKAGRHIVVVQQSESFMRHVARYPGDFVADAIVKLADLTERSITIRLWSRAKHSIASTLPDDLVGAHALVTYSSAAAVMAVLRGVPVVSARVSAAYTMGGALDDIEHLPMPNDRERWASILADNQFTMAEMKSGLAWRMLNE